jgi:hypothetical protein
MNLPTENSGSVGVGDGEQLGRGIAVLEPQVERMRWCLQCESEQHFVAAWFSLEGLIGVCLCCGCFAVDPFTRVNSEAA